MKKSKHELIDNKAKAFKKPKAVKQTDANNAQNLKKESIITTNKSSAHKPKTDKPFYMEEWLNKNQLKEVRCKVKNIVGNQELIPEGGEIFKF